MSLRGLEISVAYAVWSSIVMAVLAFIGMTFLGESVSAAKVPWYKPQLDEVLEEADKYKRQASLLRKTLEQVAKERDAAVATGKLSNQTIMQMSDAAVEREKLKDKALEEVGQMRAQTEQGKHEREKLHEEVDRLRARVQTLQCEVDDLKTAMTGYVEDRIRAERAAADSLAAVARAQGEARAARAETIAITEERDKAREQCQKAEGMVKATQKASAAEATRAAEEQRARLEALTIEVKPSTKQLVSEKAAEVSALDEAELLARSSRFRDPEALWPLLEPYNFAGQFDTPIALLSANWLKTSRPARLPLRQQLPPEAFIPARTLRPICGAIDKGLSKGMIRPLPIICVLLPRSALGDGTIEHPDPSGEYLTRIVNTLEQRWPEFTKPRGGKPAASTGVTDVGVFIDWACLHMASMEVAPSSNSGGASGASKAAAPPRKRSEHEQRVFDMAQKELHALFAHELTTVWIFPEGKQALGRPEIKFREAWPSYLYLLASLIKPSNLNELLQWPLLLDLSGGSEAATAVCRRAPCEPLTFHPGHEHGACLGAAGLVATQYPEALCAMMAGVEELDFRRCNWGDEEISAGALRDLKILSLDNNDISDAGASALFTALSPGEGAIELPIKDLKALTLNNNAINDSSALALAGAITSSNTLAGCKVNFDGNPATKVARTAVKKALAKAKKPS
eukprot:jgi/Chrpa1/1339/Chrysochromulina_OHIO_Genome00010811-RA